MYYDGIEILVRTSPVSLLLILNVPEPRTEIKEANSTQGTWWHSVHKVLKHLPHRRALGLIVDVKDVCQFKAYINTLSDGGAFNSIPFYDEENLIRLPSRAPTNPKKRLRPFLSMKGLEVVVEGRSFLC